MVSAPSNLVARQQRASSFAADNPLWLIGAGCFLYATGPVMVRASSVSGPIFSLWRLWFGVGIFGALALTHIGMTKRWPGRRGLSWAFAAGLGFGLHQLFFMTAVKQTSVVDVLLIGTLSPIVVAAAAVPMFGEHTGLPFRLWTLVAIAGTTGVVLAGSSGAEGEPVGMLLAVLNVFAFAAFFLFSKAGRPHIDTVPFLGGVMVVAAVFVSLFVLATGGSPGTATGNDLLLMLGAAIVPGTLGHFVMTWPLQWVPANVPPVMRLSIPFLSGTLAWVTLGEGFEVAHLVAGAVTIAGVAGALMSPSGRRLVAREVSPELAGVSEA